MRQMSSTDATQNNMTGVAPSVPIGQMFLEKIDERQQWQRDLIEEMLNNENLEFGEAPSLHSRAMEHFLANLRFRGMPDRFDQVENAFEKTFKWLFQQTQRSKAWYDFQTWLANDAHNIYWVSGKPGSGKSTLMKFIDANPDTATALKQWVTDPKELVRASFYFWSGGSHLHKSREGMLRSLLIQLFTQVPELAVQHCPKRAQIHHWFGEYSLPWTLAELEEVITAVLHDSKPKFFLLIDGLDECVDDHEELVRFLRGLTKKDNVEKDNVKICLSSRPWQDFEDEYNPGPHLRLHELTTKDIRHYVKSHLEGKPGFKDLRLRDEAFADSLIEDITRKSQGVFLWVKFVVRDVAYGLKNGLTISILQEQLGKLPTDLKDLFRELLNMIEENHKEHAYQIFCLVREAHAPISLLTLSYAQEDWEKPITELGNSKITINEKEGRCKTMTRRLMSHCKGLLEVVASSTNMDGNTQDEDLLDDADVATTTEETTEENARTQRIESLASYKVQYMHRTVKDFLDDDSNWNTFSGVIASKSSRFDPCAALCKASLIRLKKTGIELMTEELFWEAVHDTLNYATKSDRKSQNPLVMELDELDRTADKLVKTPWGTGSGRSLFLKYFHTAYVDPVLIPGSSQKHLQSFHWSVTQTRGGSKHSFLCLAVQYGLYSYVKTKLEAGFPIEQPKHSRSLLECTVRDHTTISTLPQPQMVGYDERISMIKMLLEHGDNPNRINTFKESPWEHLLNQIMKAYKVERTGRGGGLRYLPAFVAPPERMEFWLSAAELMVQHGANCWRIDVRDVTAVLAKHDEERAAALKRIVLMRRPSLVHSWNAFTRRKSTSVVVSVGLAGDTTQSVG